MRFNAFKNILLLTVVYLFSFTNNVSADDLASVFLKSPQRSHFANFTLEKFLKSNGRTITSSGKAIIIPKEGICWLTEKPRVKAWLITEKGTINPDLATLPDTMRNERSNPIFSSIMQNFMALLNGDISSVTEKFQLTSKLDADKSELSLVPRDNKMQKMIPLINIFTDKDRVSRILINEASGGYTNIIFTEDSEEYHPSESLEELCHATR